jgi:hypothetical protein
MQTLRSSLLLLAFLVLVPLTAAAQTTAACDGPIDPLFVLPPAAPGAEYGFAMPPAEHASVVKYTLRIYDADGPATPLSVQDVMKASVTLVGTSVATPSLSCYALPVVPVDQIPRGRRLVMTIQAVGTVPELSALESGRGDPFGLRLNPTGAPQRKP